MSAIPSTDRSGATGSLVASPRVQEGFCPTADGQSSLYWRSEGDGPALVLCNGLGVSTFFWTHVVRAFAGSYRVVVWDYRAHGKSGPSPKSGFGIAACADDLRTLLDHLKIETCVLAGHSLGSQVILEAYKRYPDRILALVPTLGGYGRTVEKFFRTRLSVPALRGLKKLAFLNLGLSQRVMATAANLPVALSVARAVGLVHPQLASDEDMAPYMTHLGQLDLPTYFQLAEDLQAHDATDLLPKIRVPVLVFGAERDLFSPPEVAEYMTRTIPGAELCMLRAGSHAALIEQPELFALRLERFLRDRCGLPRMTRLPQY